MKKQILTIATIALAAGALIITGCKKADTTPPVITLVSGNDAIYLGTTWVDAGATAEDNEDGNLTSSITVSGTVNSNSAGTYTIHYSVTDKAGNEGTADRTVTVSNQAAALAGNYNVKDSVWGGSVSNYTDVVTISSTVNGRIFVTKFGNYQNANCILDVAPSLTTLVSPIAKNPLRNSSYGWSGNVGSPSALHNFSYNTSVMNPTITHPSTYVITFDYHDIDSTNSVFSDARTTMTQQ
jgi:hypothetical protein